MNEKLIAMALLREIERQADEGFELEPGDATHPRVGGQIGFRVLIDGFIDLEALAHEVAATLAASAAAEAERSVREHEIAAMKAAPKNEHVLRGFLDDD